MSNKKYKDDHNFGRIKEGWKRLESIVESRGERDIRKGKRVTAPGHLYIP